jgi:hypothetical protein
MGLHPAGLPPVDVKHAVVRRQSPAVRGEQSHKYNSVPRIRTGSPSVCFHESSFINHMSNLADLPEIIN